MSTINYVYRHNDKIKMPPRTDCPLMRPKNVCPRNIAKDLSCPAASQIRADDRTCGVKPDFCIALLTNSAARHRQYLVRVLNGKFRSAGDRSRFFYR